MVGAYKYGGTRYGHTMLVIMSCRILGAVSCRAVYFTVAKIGGVEWEGVDTDVDVAFDRDLSVVLMGLMGAYVGTRYGGMR